MDDDGRLGGPLGGAAGGAIDGAESVSSGAYADGGGGAYTELWAGAYDDWTGVGCRGCSMTGGGGAYGVVDRLGGPEGGAAGGGGVGAS